MACGVRAGMFNALPGRYIYNERNDDRPPVAHAPGNAEQELIACAQQQSKRQSLTRYLSGRESSIRISALPNRADAQRMNLKRSYARVHARASRHLSAATNNPAPSEMWPQRPYAASV